MEMPWKNPEFLRHTRRELRPVRVLIAIGVPLLLCVLLMLVMREGERDSFGHIRWNAYWDDLYATMLIVQGILLAGWCASTCGHTISSERQLKTFDFLRTTRLTSGELLLGSILGRPIVGFLIVGVTLPITLLAGSAAGHPILRVLSSVAVILVVCLCFAFGATLFSMLTEKPRSGELIVLMLVYLWGVFTISQNVGFLGWNSASPALAIIPALMKLNGQDSYTSAGVTSFFGHGIPQAWMTVILYGTMALWIGLMLVRNFKRDREEVRLLSRVQAMAFVLYINVIFLSQVSVASPAGNVYSMLNSLGISGKHIDLAHMMITRTTSTFLGLNAAVFYLVGIAMLAPAGSLKTWFRERQRSFASYWSEDAPPAAWMIVAALVAWTVLAGVTTYYTHRLPSSNWSLRTTGLRLAIILVYSIRDVVFLQWCAITRMKSPLMKGTLLLSLYYFSASMLAAFAQAVAQAPNSMVGYALVTPAGAFGDVELMASLQGAGVQVGIIVLLLVAIRKRLVQKGNLVPAIA